MLNSTSRFFAPLVVWRRRLIVAGIPIAALITFPVIARAVAAQGTRPDSAMRDSLRKDSTAASHLGRVRVSVARSDVTAQTAPWATGVQTKSEIAGDRSKLGIDEALPNIPGVYVSNRYNSALDQRLSIPGPRARENLGVRGGKVLLECVPRAVRDGQS